MTPRQRLGANIRAVRLRSGMSLRDVVEDQMDLCPVKLFDIESRSVIIAKQEREALEACFGEPMRKVFEGANS